MEGKVIVTAPLSLKGPQVFKVYIDDIEQEQKLKKGEKGEFLLKKDSTICGKIQAPIGSLKSDSLLVSSQDVTEITYEVKTGLLSNTLEVISKKITPCSSYQETFDEKAIFEFEGGVGDKLTVYEDRIIIKHKGALNFMSMGIHGDKTVYLENITAIQFKLAGVLSGHIQFSIVGGNESKGGILNAASDENTITFVESKNYEAQQIYEYLNGKLREFKTAKNTPVIQTAQLSSADELKKFKELLDMGVITQEEFDQKKKQLLGL